MMVTTGARSTRSSGLSSPWAKTSASWKATFSTSNPNSPASSTAVSWSIELLSMMPVMPMPQSFLSTSGALTPIILAISPTATVSSILMTRLCAAGVVIWVCFCFLPICGFFLPCG